MLNCNELSKASPFSPHFPPADFLPDQAEADRRTAWRRCWNDDVFGWVVARCPAAQKAMDNAVAFMQDVIARLSLADLLILSGSR